MIPTDLALGDSGARQRASPPLPPPPPSLLVVTSPPPHPTLGPIGSVNRPTQLAPAHRPSFSRRLKW
eukprot:scaffold140539_cov99-Phaeocystis_antarctica.AAC.1